MYDASKGRFTFEVDLKANKPQVCAEVAQIFNVHPVEIKTVVRKGTLKKSLRKKMSFKTPNIKIAVLTLKAGEKIDAFDVASS